MCSERLAADRRVIVHANRGGSAEAVIFDVIDGSLNGSCNVTRLLIPPMIHGRWGWVVNISSVAAITGNRGRVNKSAAKGALHAASKSPAR